MNPSENGWCGTCYPGERKPGEPGYCDRYNEGLEKDNDVEMSNPTLVKNWGWCRGICQQKGPTNSDVLMETKIDILSKDECADLASDLSVNATTEICAGHKNYFPKIQKWKRIRNTKKNSYYFRPMKTVTNYLGISNRKYDFYIGGTDSCQGTHTKRCQEHFP